MESLIPIDPIEEDGVEETELFNSPDESVEEEVVAPEVTVKPEVEVEPEVAEEEVEEEVVEEPIEEEPVAQETVEEEVAQEPVKPEPKPKAKEKKEAKKGEIPSDLLSLLETKVDEMVHSFHNSSDENSELRNEIVTLKTQNDMLNKQIADLESQLSAKEAKIESILEKLKPMMGGE